jgi:2-isopropylmalate synthase
MDHKLKKKPDEVFQMAVEAVKYARNLSAEVEFSPEDATRSEMDFLCRVVEGVIAAGATVVNIPDTVGYTVPEEFHAMITEIRQRVPNIDKAKISVHCHNDLGLGVANTIAAIQAGARQAEVTINGIGERAGNASLEELVMALNVRQDVLPYSTDINTSHIYNSSRMLATIIGFPIARNKAIVGDNAFAHEAGIHQDGVLKYRQTYEIMTPKTVGRDDSKIVLGRHSGLHGYTKRLEDLSITLTDDELKHTYERFLQIADRKKEIFDEDIFAIVGDELGRHLTTMKLEYFNIISGNTVEPTATVRISDGDTVHEETATGDGSVDAIFRAIERAVGIETTLEEYNVQAVTPGKQALGEVSVIVRIAGRRFSGTGSSTDVLEASARAYVSAVARFAALKEATDE